jgi:hypothetical protein
VEHVPILQRTTGLFIVISETINLVKKFEMFTWDKTVSVCVLERNRKYLIIRAKRLKTRICPALVLTFRDSQEDLAQVFLPRRYSDVVSDDHIEKFNIHAVSLYLVYSGVCEATKPTC